MRVTIEVTAGPAQGKLFAFDEPDLFIVGRASDSKIALPNDPYLSRQHFVMEIAPPNCKITDLDSKNGTFVNGVRYGGRKPDPNIKQAPGGIKTVTIETGEVVVGDTRLAISSDAPPSSRKRPASDPEQRGAPSPAELAAAAAKIAPRPKRRASSASLARAEKAQKKSEEKPTQQLVDNDRTGFEAPPPNHDSDCTVLEGPTPAAAPAPQFVMLMAGESLRCARCGRDVTTEVGKRGRVPGAEYICHDCRANNAFAMKARVRRSRRAFEGQHGEAPRALPASKGKDPNLSTLNFPGYEVLDVLGSGGMGVVYRCTRNRDGAVVAIKSLLPNVPVTFENYRIFHREIELTRKLRHPNIVEVLDHGHVKGSYYCVLEFIDGLSLKDYVAQMGGKLTLKQAAPLMLDVLAGLEAAHRAQIETRSAGPRMLSGIVHRDLKPENILLKRDAFGWTPKIADFGIAKNFESAGMTDMTIAGVCGTPTYWPREQLTHYRYLHPATDVFSVACVFYEVLTGRCARPGMQETLMHSHRKKVSPQLADFMRVICTNPIPPIRTILSTVPPLVAAVLDRALLEVEVPIDETEMRDTLQRLRYADAGDFRAALIDAFRASGI